MKISVLIKEPGKNPRHVNIENSLKNLQNTVGGYIETVTLADDCVVICNEEGRLQGLPYCCTIAGVDFVGPVVIAGLAGEEFADLPGEWKDWKQTFRNLWEEYEKANCKFCGKPVKRQNVYHAACWENEAFKVVEQFCDEYCRWPHESKDEEELQERHCDSCAAVRFINLGL